MIIDLWPLQKRQAKLREHIRQNHTIEGTRDTLEKLTLALSVEIGECANEWRQFKFWSHDQKPRFTIKETCGSCGGRGIEPIMDSGVYPLCDHCSGDGVIVTKEPVLEEYVDCLAFILDIGLELGYSASQIPIRTIPSDTLKHFNKTIQQVGYFSFGYFRHTQYYELLKHVIQLGLSIGFLWEEIERAYVKKMEVNHERQESGY